MTLTTMPLPPRTPALMQPMLALGERAGARIIDAEGLELEFEDGVRAIDVSAQDSSVILGHRDATLHGAVATASLRAFVSDTATGSPDRDAAVSEMMEIAFGGRFAAGIRFTLTGSEAIDLALALAQGITGRQLLLSRNDSYHGAVGLSRDVTTHSVINGGLSRPGRGWSARFPSGVPCAIFPGAEDTPESVLTECFAGAAAVITDYGSGHVYRSPAWFDRVGRAARAAGALWIHDETVSAYGRYGTGKWFHFEELTEQPDIVALAKCITGGAAPGAALVLSQRAAALLDGRRWAAGSTYWGHHLQVQAIRTVLSIMAERELVAAVVPVGEYLGTCLAQLVRAHPDVLVEARGSGLIRSLQVVDDQADLDAEPAQDFSALARVHGAMVSPYGRDHLWIVPPLVIGTSGVDRVIDAFDKAARRMT